jgi:hypothetical protein
MWEWMFQPVADSLGLAIDQARYALLMFASLPVAMVFRHALHPSHTSLVTRHTVLTLLGLAMATLCFNWDVGGSDTCGFCCIPDPGIPAVS